MAVIRGCGTRTKCGIYLETETSPYGFPLEWFMVDPPAPVPSELSIPPRGVQEFQDPHTGVWHIIDWVGAESYPSVSDFEEEVRRFALSRKVQPSANFGLLTKDSQWWGVHPHGFLRNWEELAEEVTNDSSTHCPKQYVRGTNGDYETWEEWLTRNSLSDWPFRKMSAPKPPIGHPLAGSMCHGLHWQVGEEAGDRILQEHGEPGTRSVVRTMPSFYYTCNELPEGFKPDWAPAFFLRLPLSRLVVIDDPENREEVRRKLEKVGRAFLPRAAEIVEE